MVTFTSKGKTYTSTRGGGYKLVSTTSTIAGKTVQLKPVTDVLGRSLRGPIGSTAEKQQTAEAQRLLRETATKERAEAPKRKTSEIVREAIIKARMKAKRLPKPFRPRPILTKREERSLLAREEIKTIAKERDRPFTRLEAQRFLKEQGGSVSDLRTARAKGFRISELPPIEKIEKIEKEPKLTLTERADKLIPELKKKGHTPELKRKKESLLSEILKEEKKLGPKIETLPLIEKRRELIRTEPPSPTRKAKLYALLVASSFIGFGLGIKQLVTDPVSTIKSIPRSLKTEVQEVGQLWAIAPDEAILKVGTELLILKGTGRALRVTGKVGGKARARLSPKFRGVKKEMITIPSQARGKTIKLKLVGQ